MLFRSASLNRILIIFHVCIKHINAKLFIVGSRDDADRWSSIDWKEARRQVRRLQMRIAKAVKEDRWNKVNALQYLLTRSFYAKLLAVKRVTSNKGKKTPGVDGVVWKGARAKWRAACSLRRRGYRPQPLRRIYIPKKNGKKRLFQSPI